MVNDKTRREGRLRPCPDLHTVVGIVRLVRYSPLLAEQAVLVDLDYALDDEIWLAQWVMWRFILILAPTPKSTCPSFD